MDKLRDNPEQSGLYLILIAIYLLFVLILHITLISASILHGNAGELGDYKELAVLPDKIARYLYEYHAESYASHDLPVLPDDRSRTDVHGVLKPHQVV